MKNDENKILVYVIEDSKIICDIMSRLELFRKDMIVKTFSDGDSAISSVKSKWPDIIFLDYYLNSSVKHADNGDKVLKKIKKFYPETPVILLTSLTDQKKISNLLKIGFNGFIHKGEEYLIDNILDCINVFAVAK